MTAPYRVLITGCRYWQPQAMVDWLVNRLAEHHPGLVIIHGAAPGIDSAFADAARRSHVAAEPHPADWGTHGKAAGPVRNERMVTAGASKCFAVHRDISTSKGTRNCAGLVVAAGIPTWLIDSDDIPPDPVRLTAELIGMWPRRQRS